MTKNLTQIYAALALGVQANVPTILRADEAHLLLDDINETNVDLENHARSLRQAVRAIDQVLAIRWIDHLNNEDVCKIRRTLDDAISKMDDTVVYNIRLGNKE